MGLDDIKVQYPERKPERFPRTVNWKKYRDNYDAIFGKKSGLPDTSKKEKSDEDRV